LLASLPMVYVGALMDRFGPRRILTVVVLLFGLACAAMSQASGLVTVFLAFLFLRMLGQGAMGLLSSNTLAMWFHRRLGLAAGMMSVGAALAMGMYPRLGLWLIQSFGWRWAYAIVGGAVWCAVLPLLGCLFRNRPEDIGDVPDGRGASPKESVERPTGGERRLTLTDALQTRAFWIMGVASALPAMIVTGVHFHAVQIFLDRGLTEADAAAMFTTFAFAFSALMLLGGVLADRAPLNLLLSLSMAGLSGGIAILVAGSAPWASRAFAVVLGGAQGVLMAVRATLWVRYYGRAHLGKIRGSLAMIEVAASSTGPFLMGTAHDYFGSYAEVLWVFVLVTAPMVGFALLATSPQDPDCK
ncbi:MFS transporter, partial [Candidatus Latescibacterota bacterium]